MRIILSCHGYEDDIFVIVTRTANQSVELIVSFTLIHIFCDKPAKRVLSYYYFYVILHIPRDKV